MDFNNVLREMVAPAANASQQEAADLAAGVAVTEAANQPNAAATLDAFLKQVRSFGRDEGNGASARLKLAGQLTEASHLGAVGEDDVDMIYEQYTKGVAMAKGLAVVKTGSDTQQKSKLRTFIKLGALSSVDGRKTFEKTRDAYKEAVVQNGNKPLSKSPFDALLAAARMQIQYPDEILPDDFILTCVYPKTKDEKLEVDKLGAIVDAMDRLRVNEETPCSEDTEAVLQTAIDSLMQRIKDMGGTSAMKKADEKLKAQQAKAEQVVAELKQRRGA